MIETIFYFPESLAKYLENLNNLSSRTITFVPPTVEGGTGTIYKGGYPYGKMTKADIQQMITTIFNENGDYVLPIASADKLGGVKIGSGLNINNVTGVLTVDFGSVNSKTSLLESELAALSASVTVNTNAITSLDGRLSQAEASILTKASASDLTSATNRIGELETRTTSLLSLASIFANSIASLDDRISSAEAGLLVKANASEVTNLSNSLDSLRNTVTTLSGNAGLNVSAYTDLERRIAEAETSLRTKADASDITTIQNSLGEISTTVTNLAASSTIYSNSITDLTNRISSAETDILTKADANVTYTKTDVDGLLLTIRSSITALSGLKTASDVKAAFADDGETIYTSGTASATLFAKIESDADSKYAAIDVVAQKVNAGTELNPDWRLDSSISVTADNIILNGNTIIDRISSYMAGQYSGNELSLDQNGLYFSYQDSGSNSYFGSYFGAEGINCGTGNFNTKVNDRDISITRSSSHDSTDNELHIRNCLGDTYNGNEVSVIHNTHGIVFKNEYTPQGGVLSQEETLTVASNEVVVGSTAILHTDKISTTGSTSTTSLEIDAFSTNIKCDLNVDGSLDLDGNLVLNSTNGGVLVDNMFGKNVTVTLTDAVLTFKNGILVNATGNAVSNLSQS